MTDFVFPSRRTDPIIRTAMMNEAELRTLTNHYSSAMAVWSGRSLAGKTTTACEMARRINAAFDADNDDGFRAVHYSVGGMGTTYHDSVKKGVRSLFHAAIGRLNERQYRSRPPELLAGLTVAELRRNRIELVLVDEAGQLSLDAIRGLVLVRDVAVNQGGQLTIVLIGRDDFPMKVEQCPQLHRRIAERVFFHPYTESETLALLAALEPRYENASLNDAELGEEIRFFHKEYQGLPGQIIPFLKAVQENVGRSERGFGLELMKAIHLST